MKVLIIEDNEYKLDIAIRILNKLGITDLTHVNNYNQAMLLCYDCLTDISQINEFDLIILDIQFYVDNPDFDPTATINPEAGYQFLYNLILYEIKKDIIIFSQEEDYIAGLRKFLLPSFEEFTKFACNNIHQTIHSLKNEYTNYLKENQKIFDSIDFVLGHAHNSQELETLIHNWVNP